MPIDIVVPLAWLAALAVAGVAALTRLAPWLTALERAAYGAVLGIVLGSLAVLALACVAGLTTTVVAGVGLLAALVTIALRPLPPPSALRGAPPPAPAAGADRGGWIVAGLVLALFVVRWAFVWAGALSVDDRGLWAGHVHIWGDWSLHLGDTTGFAWGDNFPPVHPRFAGLPHTYHYLTSITAACMVRLGMSPLVALPVQSFLLCVLAWLATWAFVRRLTGSRGAATLGVVLFVAGGGLGWGLTLGEVLRAPDGLRALLDQPWDRKLQEASNVRWLNVFYAYWLPQRSTLYGFPLGMLALACLHHGLRVRAVWPFALAGLVCGLLPTASLGAMLALALLTPVLAVVFFSRRWLAFFLAWGLVAGPQVLVQQGGGPGALSAFRWHLGWVAGGQNWLWFWLVNLGVFVPLLVLALAARDLLPRLERRFLSAFMPLFVIANLFVFQPWPWDNTKVLVWWFLAVCVLAAAWLARAWREHPAPLARAGLALLLVPLTLSGVLADLDQALGHGRHVMLTRDELELARQVREHTPPRALFVVGLQHNHPVSMMAGRRVVMSYPGWMWTQGVRYGRREHDVRDMLGMTAGTDSLLRRYQIDFVAIGPIEKEQWGADADAYRVRFPRVVQTETYEVFDVRGLRTSGEDAPAPRAPR